MQSVNSPQASTSLDHHNGDLSALIEEIADDDDDYSWMNDVNIEDPTKVVTSQLDKSCEDFDKNAGSSWIFPIGYEKREYQYNISQSCLFVNTLVCLPTGLGKTFIASVVIYNFYRWFPRSKIIFMAPTKPLVDQQIDACYKVVGIPSSDSVVLTGQISKEKRIEFYKSKRLFFATPQTIKNDLCDRSFPVQDIKLLVFDEAHNAKGKYAYCEVIREVNAVNQKFRVVALSATPGKPEDVTEVIKNLLIAKLEIRSKDAKDVKEYSFNTRIDIVKVPLGELTDIRDRFRNIAEPYLRKLMSFGAISGCNDSKGWLIVQQKKVPSNHPHIAEVKKLFPVAISLKYSMELLERHGLQIFLKSFVDESNSSNLKYFVHQDIDLKNLLCELQEKYKGTSPLDLNLHPLPNGEIPVINNANLFYGHEKFDFLKTKILEYFQNDGSKSIIFVEYRDTATMVYTLLLELRPLVLPSLLIGQKGGVTQKQQKAVMMDFRSGKANVLVATSVGEEGLDIGEVDLVICFDTSSKREAKFIQRIGRTARKRTGRVIMFASEGKEEETVREMVKNKDKLNKSLNNSKVKSSLYPFSPRLVPLNFNPKCVETKFHIPETTEVEPAKRTKKVEAVKEPKARKSADSSKIGTRSITAFYKPKTKNDEEEVEPIQEEQIVQPPSRMHSKCSVVELCAKIRESFVNEISSIIANVPQIELLKIHLEISKKNALEFVDNFTKLDLSVEDEDLPPLNLDFDDLIDVPVLDQREGFKSPAKRSFDSQDDQLINMESLYGNQFSSGVRNSINLPTFSPGNIKKPSPQTGQTCSRKKVSPFVKKKTPVKDSPLLKAFDKQRKLSTSTPVTTRMLTSFFNRTGTPVESSPKPCQSRQEVPKKSNIPGRNSLNLNGFQSIDDIFADIDSDEELLPAPSAPAKVFSSASIEQASTSSAQKNSIKQQDDLISKLLDEDEEAFLNIPMEDEVVESSLPEEAQLPRRRILPKLEINLEEFFVDCDSSSDELNRNVENVASNDSQRTQVYDLDEIFEVDDYSPEKENIQIVNSVIIKSPSPKKDLAVRPRPNLSKLLNALSSPNFLQLSPPKVQYKSPVSSKVVQQPAQSFKSPTSHFKNPTPRIKTSQVSLPSTSNRIPIPSTSRGPQRKVVQSDDELIVSDDDNQLGNHCSPFALPIRKRVVKKRKRNDFFCTQAGVDGKDSSDEDEMDESLAGFVANDTLDLTVDHIDIQTKYLESLRSPSAMQRGIFKIPQLQPPMNHQDIYSQVPYDEEEDDWEMDSFVVADQAEEPAATQMDELEIAEKILKDRKRQARQQQNRVKRRKIVKNDDSSDEDEDLKKMRLELNSKPEV